MSEIERARAKEAFLEALKKTMGIITAATEMVGISRRTYYDWMRDDLEFKEAVEEGEERRLDFAEGKLFKNIEGGDMSAIKFYLEAHGEKRGYGRKKLDITSNGQTMTGVVVLPATEIHEMGENEDIINDLIENAE
jgi:hypothetical protein